MRALLFVGLVATQACGPSGSSGSPVVRTTGADASEIAQSATYRYATAEEAPSGYAKGLLRPDVIAEAKRAVDVELQRKGYRYDPNGALIVRLSSGNRTVLEQPTGRAAAAGVPEDVETEGALVIDMFDRASGKALFHGYAREVLEGGEVKAKEIQTAVAKILERVPTRER